MQRCCSWGAAAEIDTVALRLGKDSEELRAGGSSKHSELQVELEVKQRWSTVSCRWSCRWSSQQWSSDDELQGVATVDWWW